MLLTSLVYLCQQGGRNMSKKDEILVNGLIDIKLMPQSELSALISSLKLQILQEYQKKDLKNPP